MSAVSRRPVALWAVVQSLLFSAACVAQPLEVRLSREAPKELAAAARRNGNAARGAVLFHLPHVGCTKCHAVDGGPSPLGPDLTKLGGDATDEYLVESVLSPSKSIRKG